MERRVTKKFDDHLTDFKNNIKSWLDDHQGIIVNDTSTPLTSEFLQYIYDYSTLQLTKEDFQKRKRVKNHVPHCDRCLAKRANDEQCTRRKKDDSDFCGTHIKGTPHGIFDSSQPKEDSVNKVEVWIQEIKGIHYYIDAHNNIYDPEDIIENKKNPSVVAKYERIDNTYSIPNLGL